MSNYFGEDVNDGYIYDLDECATGWNVQIFKKYLNEHPEDEDDKYIYVAVVDYDCDIYESKESIAKAYKVDPSRVSISVIPTLARGTGKFLVGVENDDDITWSDITVDGWKPEYIAKAAKLLNVEESIIALREILKREEI